MKMDSLEAIINLINKLFYLKTGYTRYFRKYKFLKPLFIQIPSVISMEIILIRVKEYMLYL